MPEAHDAATFESIVAILVQFLSPASHLAKGKKRFVPFL